jgi:hypothetical protein
MPLLTPPKGIDSLLHPMRTLALTLILTLT